ncbi:MAG: alpha/beta fold hydrolase [Oscillospiraceae bacterium]|jgi:carboxylesterase|nr:alpha/beta fold hydrolase [Oscillospiraceae bacterium]
MQNLNIKNNNTACVIIHGYAGGTFEVEYLCDYLKSNGINAFLVKLAGHGATAAELAKTDETQWLASAKEQIEEIYKNNSRLILIGFSMGGLISANLVNEFKAVKMVTINTPYFVFSLKNIIKTFFSKSVPLKQRLRFYSMSIKKTTPKSNADFLRLLKSTRKIFAEIKCPVMIVQTEDDTTSRPKSALRIAAKVGAGAKVKYYPVGEHLVLLSEAKDDVCKDILSFVTE